MPERFWIGRPRRPLPRTGRGPAYDARTDGTRNLLRERLVYTAAWHLAETLPNIPNPPSPFRADLSGRVMLDIWGGSFATVQERLHTLADAGFGPGAAILHDWQRDGYDNGLPAHVPANPNLGGDPAMAALVGSGPGGRHQNGAARELCGLLPEL